MADGLDLSLGQYPNAAISVATVGLVAVGLGQNFKLIPKQGCKASFCEGRWLIRSQQASNVHAEKKCPVPLENLPDSSQPGLRIRHVVKGVFAYNYIRAIIQQRDILNARGPVKRSVRLLPVLVIMQPLRM